MAITMRKVFDYMGNQYIHNIKVDNALRRNLVTVAGISISVSAGTLFCLHIQSVYYNTAYQQSFHFFQ